MITRGSGLFILDEAGTTPVGEADFVRWAEWTERARTVFPLRGIVRQEHVGRSWISTVFLGISFESQPKLWETMIFGGKLNEFQVRCGGSKEQAEAMHADAVMAAKVAEGRWVPVCAFGRERVAPFLDDQIYEWRDWLAVAQRSFLSIKEITFATIRRVRSGSSQSLDER